ncbi:MAG: hypothetical protein GKS05_00500 [Nitrospirales bacterium]|nr:hypothetical protein [Nitrospirales bacterium]
MNFDPAVSAQQALHQAVASEEFGDLEAEVIEAEETFSSDHGEEARYAYEILQRLGASLPQARHFQEFLIYITWQQVTAETLPRYFQKGLTLCDGFLLRFGNDIVGTQTYQQILDIRESFQGGLGLEDEDAMPEYDEDAFQGGD